MIFKIYIFTHYILGSNFNEELELLKQQYAERTSETLRAVKTAMAFAPQEFWRCDPTKHESGTSNNYIILIEIISILF